MTIDKRAAERVVERIPERIPQRIRRRSPDPAAAAAALRRNNVQVVGADDARPLVFLHGFGCSQAMWRHLVPDFATDHRVVTLDLVGAGESDVGAYDPRKYDSLDGYADDLHEVLDALDLHDVVIVGHSVSAMIAVLAANSDRQRIGALVLIGPSPRYLDAPGYVGGFSRGDIDTLLAGLDANYLGWSGVMAPRFMGNPEQPELGRELELSFCRTEPSIARHFASVTFLSDHRDDLARVAVPTLVLQCSDDPVAPEEVGLFVHRTVPGSTYVRLAATGHLPHMSAPTETAGRIREFLERSDAD